MDKLNTQELEAWRRYAASALEGILSGQDPEKEDAAVAIAASYADRMVEEERKRRYGTK